MKEPESGFVKDDDGFTWRKDSVGWSLVNHDQLCYLQQPFRRVEREYGPLRHLTRYEKVYLET